MTAPNIQDLTLTYQSAFMAPATVFALTSAGGIEAEVSGFPQAGFTVVFWANTTQTTTGAVIFSYDDQAVGTPDRVWIKSPNALQIGFGTNATASTGLSIADGQWHQVAVTFAPATSTTIAVGVYIDGVLSWFAQNALTRASGSWPDSSADLQLCAGVAGEPGFVGQLSEFQLWNGVRTQSEIMSGLEVRATQGGDAVLVWALTSTPQGATMTGGSYVTGNPQLLFRTGASLTAAWTSLGAGYTYDLTVTASDNTYYAPATGLSTATYPISSFAINTTYTVSVSGVQGADVGAASSATTTTLNLWQPTLSTALPQTGQYVLSWTAVDQASSYQVTLTETANPATVTTQSATTLDLSSQAFGSQSWTYSIAALSGGAAGPATAIPSMPSAPVVSLVYDQSSSTSGTLTATLTTSDPTLPYLLDITQGSSTYATPLLAAGTSSWSQTLATNGQTFTATARGVPTGAIGTLSATASATVQSLLGPIIATLSADGTAHTITATWNDASGTPSGATYVAELWTMGASPAMVGQPMTSSIKTCTFNNEQIVDNASFQVRVRAVVSNSYGLWSAWQALTVGGLPQVQNVCALSATNGDITVSWAAVTGSGVTYVVHLYGGSVNYSSTQSGTSVTLTKAQTGVVCSTVYSVTVTAQATGPIYGPTSAVATVTACQQSDCPTGDSGKVSDPLNVATGAYVYVRADLVVPAVMPLIFTTYYSGDWPTPSESPLVTSTPLGNRWSHTYMTQVVISGSDAYVVWGRQQRDRYVVPASVTGVYAANGAAIGSQLYRNADLTYTLTLSDASRYVFSSGGVLTTIFDRYGNSTALVYQSGQLSTVTDKATGNKLTFGYSGGQLQTVTDKSGRLVTYTVTAGNLTKVVDAAGNSTTFQYTGASLMQSAVDGNGLEAFYNTYTGAQVTKQQDARALAAGLTYATLLNYQNTTQNGVAVVLTTGTDRAGNAVSYTSLQANGATTASQIALGGGQIQAIERSYDGFNNLVSETIYTGTSAGYSSGMGNTKTYAYDGGGNCITETTPLGGGNVYAISRTFDASSNKLTEAFYQGPSSGFSQGAGNRWTYTYYADNTVHTASNPLGQTTTLTYVSGSIHGLVETATDALGNVSNYTYQSGLLHTVTNALGEVTTFGYDTAGRRQQIAVADSTGTVQRTTKYAYNGNNQILSTTVWYAGQTEAQAFVTSHGYDGDGNRTSTTLPTGVETILGYNPNNYLSQVKYAALNGVNRLVDYIYDNIDFIRTKTLTSNATTPSPISTGYVCDAIGRVTQITDPNANVYSFSNAMIVSGSAPYATQTVATWPLLTGDPTTYTDVTVADALGRPTAVTARNGQTVTTAYTTQPDATTQTTQLVVTTTYPAAVTGGASLSTVAVYDAAGRPVSFADQASHVTTFGYAAGTGGPNNSKTATVTVTDPNLSTRTYSYDAKGQLVGEVIGAGAAMRSFAYVYDAIGRTTSVTESQGSASTATTYIYGYDAASNTTMVSVGRPGYATGSTLQHYNGTGRLVAQDDPFGRSVSYAYTPWGSLNTYTDGRGQTFTYIADDAGRLKQTNVSGGTSVVYTLDNDGNRLNTVAGSQTVGCTFDQWNRMLTRTGVEGATIRYSYWPTNQVKVLTYSDGKTVSYGLDNLQRLTTVTDWNTPARVTTYGYTGDNRLNSIAFANGAAASYTFDPGGRLVALSHNSGGLVVAQWNAQYDALDQLSQVTVIEPLPPALSSASNTFTYTAGNQFDTVNGAAAAYDADGQYLGESAATPVFAYDAYGRVTSSTVPDGPAASYTYDPDGLRIAAVVGGTTSNAVFDINAFQAPAVERGDPFRATVAATEAQTGFGTGGTLPLYAGAAAPVAMERATDRLLELRDADQSVKYRFVYGLGIIAQEDSAGNYRIYHSDSTGNTWAMTDATGAISDANVFGPFGEYLGGFGSTATPFRFAGQFGVADDGTGVLYMRARSYMTSQFRFLQPDYLLGNPQRPQSFNPYAYVRGNPAQASDPLGLDKLSAGKLAGIVVGSIAGAAVLAGAIVTGLAAAGGYFSGGIGFGSAVSAGAGRVSNFFRPKMKIDIPTPDDPPPGQSENDPFLRESSSSSDGEGFELADLAAELSDDGAELSQSFEIESVGEAGSAETTPLLSGVSSNAPAEFAAGASASGGF